ncbi:hypothetical protein [Thermococcus sp.]
MRGHWRFLIFSFFAVFMLSIYFGEKVEYGSNLGSSDEMPQDIKFTSFAVSYTVPQIITNDTRLQEIIKNTTWSIDRVFFSNDLSKVTVFVRVGYIEVEHYNGGKLVGGEYYKLVIDLENKTVLSVAPSSYSELLEYITNATK